MRRLATAVLIGAAMLTTAASATVGVPTQGTFTAYGARLEWAPDCAMYEPRSFQFESREALERAITNWGVCVDQQADADYRAARAAIAAGKEQAGLDLVARIRRRY